MKDSASDDMKVSIKSVALLNNYCYDALPLPPNCVAISMTVQLVTGEMAQPTTNYKYYTLPEYIAINSRVSCRNIYFCLGMGGVDLCIYRVHAITKYSSILLGFHTKAMV